MPRNPDDAYRDGFWKGAVLMFAFLSLCFVFVLMLSGCTTTGRARAAVAREQQTPHFHPQSAIEPLRAFQSAVLGQFQTGGMEPEQFALVMSWIGASLTTLRGAHPDEWEATARTGWPGVRSAIGPFETLAPFSRLMESLLE